MNTCKTCKWWNKFDEDDPCGASGFGACKKETTEGNRADFMIDTIWPEPTTGPDFGCIHWTAK